MAVLNNTDSCGNCKFYQITSSVCRRYPANLLKHSGEFCGEHRPKPKPAPKPRAKKNVEGDK